jgi:hypothetical protein
MRLTTKIIATTAACCGVASAAVAAAAGGAPADLLLDALKPSNLILVVAGGAMIGLAAGRGNATSATGRAGFRADRAGSLLQWMQPGRSARSPSLARIARPAQFRVAA